MSGTEGLNWIEELLSKLPTLADVALVLRHAEREIIPSGTFGVDVPLTAQGATSAERLGARLSGIRKRIKVTSSPVPRCVQTAEAILRGAGRPELEVNLDWRLGHPGPFVVDTELSRSLFLEIGILEITRHQLTETEPPAGMRETSEGVELLLNLTTENILGCGHLKVFVTHDAILAVFAAYLYGLSIDEISWPGYLDGLLLWRSSDRLHFAWRALQQSSHPFGR